MFLRVVLQAYLAMLQRYNLYLQQTKDMLLLKEEVLPFTPNLKQRFTIGFLLLQREYINLTNRTCIWKLIGGSSAI